MTTKKTAVVKESKARDLNTSAVKPRLKTIKTAQPDSVAAPAPVIKSKTIGEILKVVRESRGESLKTISTSLRISERYLVAIETMTLADLPEQVYALGFVRSYAQYLGVDPQKSVTQFKAEIYASATVTKQMSVLRPINPSGFPAKNIIWASMIVIAIATAIGYIFFGKTPTAPIEDDVAALLKPLEPVQTVSASTPEEDISLDGSAVDDESPNDEAAEAAAAATTPVAASPVMNAPSAAAPQGVTKPQPSFVVPPFQSKEQAAGVAGDVAKKPLQTDQETND